jgi:two-component system LytT family response regulator
MNKLYSILIVDDLEIHRENLRNQLSAISNQIDSIFEVNNVKGAIEILMNEQIDLVFLDVEMPEVSGFDLIKLVPRELLTFEVIFVTAYDRYAIQAIRNSALDFILKPVQQNELTDAFNKFIEKRNEKLEVLNHKLLHLINSKENTKSTNRIGLPTMQGYIFINEEDIIQCEADNTYTIFQLTNNKKIVVSKTLKECEETLNKNIFFRLHHSHLVNLGFVREYVRGEGGHVVLINEQIVPVSRSKKQTFLSMVKRI